MKEQKFLKVVDVYKSFQGEGLDIGLPCIFVRFAGCNLKCEFCDSIFASREKETKFKCYTVGGLIAEIKSAGEVLGICLTGGEPFVQDDKELNNLLYNLKSEGYFIDIQTNGVLLPNLKCFKYVDRFSVSPKLSNSGNTESIQLKILSKYLKKYAYKTFFKFVISNQKDFAEMEAILTELFHKEKRSVPVVVQPNIDLNTAEKISSQIKAFEKILNLTEKNASFVKQYGIRIIPQFHKFLYNNQKRV